MKSAPPQAREFVQVLIPGDTPAWVDAKVTRLGAKDFEATIIGGNAGDVHTLRLKEEGKRWRCEKPVLWQPNIGSKLFVETHVDATEALAWRPAYVSAASLSADDP